MMATKQLSAKITIGGAVSSSLRAAVGGTKGLLGDLGRTIKNLERNQRAMGKAARDAALDGSKNVDRWRTSYVRLTDQLERARRAQTRLQAAQNFRDKANAISGKLHGAATTAGITGGAIMAAFMPTIAEAKRQQSELAKISALGFNPKDAAELTKAATGQRAFGVSILHATETARDLATAFGDTHHAIEALPQALKQRTALSLYDAQHGTNLVEGSAYSIGKVIELRNGTKDMDEYRKQANMSHQVMVATGGRVNGQEMQNALRTGGIALKAMNDDAFYYGGSHFMQEMGGDTFGTASMSLYQALAQGRTTKRAAENLINLGLIGDKSKMRHDKSGQMTFLNPGALKDYDTFVSDPQKWVEQTFIPILRKKGIDPDNITKVAEVAGQIVSNRTGANLLATRVAQRGVVSKEFANAQRADNIDQGFDRAKESAAGKELNAEERLADVKQRIGTSIMPTYIRALEKVATLLEAVNDFSQSNPGAFKAMALGIGGMGVALVAAVPVLMTASGIIQTISLLRLARAAAGLSSVNTALNGMGGATAGATRGLLAFMGKLGLVGALSGIAIEGAGALGLPTPGDIAAQGNGVGADNIRKGEWWKASANLSAGDFIKARKWKVFDGMSDDAIADKLMGKAPPAAPKTPPEAPQMGAGYGGQWGGTTVQQTNHFNITQQPGESQQELARRIAEEQRRAEEVRQRGNFTDKH